MAGRCNALVADHTVEVEGKQQLADFSLQLESVGAEWKLSTDRVFLDDTLTQRLRELLPNAQPVLTYLVNGMISSQGGTPYSMVTAREDPALGENGMAVSQWLADDQKLNLGDTVELRYFTMGTGRQLVEAKHSVQVAAILPMTDARVNASWTPQFPGVSESENCRDWKPGIPMDKKTIRDVDEKYWDDYKGTPKGFIPLALGQKLWRNRFGSVTSLRFKTEEAETALRQRLASGLKLANIALSPRDFGAEATVAAKGTVDFGGLFLGLSMFLITAALVFATLLFLFMLEQRASQLGVLLALGWSTARLRWAVFAEAGLMAVVGSLLGLAGGVVYTRLALAGLNGRWNSATGGMKLQFALQPMTMVIALLTALIITLGTLWWTSRKLLRTEPRELISGTLALGRAQLGKRWRWAVAIGLLLACVLSLAAGRARLPEAVAGMFFGSGVCLLTAALAAVRGWMQKLSLQQSTVKSLAQISQRGMVRRPGRSLAAVGIMASGIFLVLAVNAFRMNSSVEPSRRDTGTGGFTFIGESSLAIYENLNTKAGRDAYSLEATEMQGVEVLALRVREGDDASCLNLNAAQSPQLVSVPAQRLHELGAFSFTQGSWQDLIHPQTTDIPAVLDMNTAMWGLKKGVGDTLDYTDAKGQKVQLRICALLASSIMQGKVMIDEAAFLHLYPDAAGYRQFLINAPTGSQATAVSELLTEQMQPRGLALQPTATRLAAFQAVQNTYIGIFTVLGALGVLLGTVGLGIMIARHVLERQGELGLMQAIGFHPQQLRRMIFQEHAWLLGLGVLLGSLCAVVAVWPSLRQAGHTLPLSGFALLLLGTFTFGLAVCAVAVRRAISPQLSEALRKE
jgi:ABC-type antimicrobial peptide transport system permease subunit